MAVTPSRADSQRASTATVSSRGSDGCPVVVWGRRHESMLFSGRSCFVSARIPSRTVRVVRLASLRHRSKRSLKSWDDLSGRALIPAILRTTAGPDRASGDFGVFFGSFGPHREGVRTPEEEADGR